MSYHLLFSKTIHIFVKSNIRGLSLTFLGKGIGHYKY